ncbi:hypothetical protein [Xenorhabdus hominickii]|uniref:Uncharacterized protein n=1 Tax=Xenorhabdus hominickii TaxID=351679 RepID=A0A2G0Q3I8_XENHO|nr:hypothetical protein [Xenorhabdus hominickii]PHM52007.1 hypothetical protein Xhom_04656 [Xenorhabdus hominickii]PHM52967.1 hypothetical protein Xhom_03849 [Xenorhabdus hominickii]PHM53761.1 hypothetical protein Xhom_03762 [Xenorhabdus hominickii]
MLIIDGEDTFTSMLKTLFISMGESAQLIKVQGEINFYPYDLVVAG